MPRVLTVDDSRAIRQIVTKQLADLGCETDEAEDGEKGLQRTEEIQFDLILLDVTMPVMDGPEMLKRLREAGNQTPVIMLTSESKRSVVAGAMKLGIEEYILKPFKPEELKAKVQKIIRLGGSDAVTPAAIAAAPSPSLAESSSAAAAKPAAGEVAGGKQFVDVLVIDDMENVQKKLRTMLPAHLSLNGAVSAQAALSLCRERVYRVVLLDTVIPDVNSAALMNQLRALQQHSSFLALTLRTAGDAEAEARSQGFDGFMFKPFDVGSMDEFVARHFDNQEVATTEGNVMTACAFAGKDDRMDRYLTRLGDMLRGELEKIAAACYDEAIADLTKMPTRRDRSARFVLDLKKQVAKVGLSLRLVGTAELKKLLAELSDTSEIPFFESAADAQAGKAA